MRLSWAALPLCWACALALAPIPSLAAAERAGVGHQAPVVDPADRSVRMFAQAEHVLTPTRNSTEAPPNRPTVVEIGLRIHQITDIDQKAERFGAVGDIRLRYLDPRLAFDPKTCECRSKILSAEEAIRLAKELGSTWPEFYLFNRQDRAFYDAQIAEIEPNGQVNYFERFSATFQAPDFDFRRFPFDTQTFFVRVLSFFPENYYVFAELTGWSGLGDQLGEEEWILSDFHVEVITTDDTRSMISFGLEGERHVTYYLLRIFLPIGIVILVSWFIFFLGDYSKRIDIATTNLLLFIAFNFVISGDLPRLGYLTFLDEILASTFVVTGLIVMANVFLRRLEMSGRTELAGTIDRYVLWCYPICYALGIGAVVAFFFF